MPSALAMRFDPAGQIGEVGKQAKPTPLDQSKISYSTSRCAPAAQRCRPDCEP